MRLTDEQFLQYQQQGYVVVEDVLSESDVASVKSRLRDYTQGERAAGFDRMFEPAAERNNIDFEHEGEPVRKFEGVGMVREDRVFSDLAHHEGIVSIVSQLLGSNMKLLRSAAMMKPPEIGSEKSVHQDAAYYPIRPMDHVTVWIALDDATTQNGCMQVVPGAHTDGLLRHETVEYDTDIELTADEYGEDAVRTLPMESGSALFQHCLLPHYTEANTTDDWRRAFIVAYMRARSRFTDESPPDWVDSVHITGEEFPGCV